MTVVGAGFHLSNMDLPDDDAVDFIESSSSHLLSNRGVRELLSCFKCDSIF